MTSVETRRDVGGWLIHWRPDLARQAQLSGAWPNLTIAQFARQRAEEDPSRIMFIEGEREISATEMYRTAQLVAGYFLSSGLRPGDVVSMQLPNWWEASAIDIAASMTGVVINPIVPINRDAEVTHMLGASKSRVLFIPASFRNFDYVQMMQRVAPNLKRKPEVVVLRGDCVPFQAWESVLKGGTPLGQPMDVDPDAVKLLMYTSGTTGRPKGVLHSHNSIHADSFKMKPAMKLGDGDRTFCPSPMTHVSGYLWGFNMPWYGNVPVVTMDTWDPVRGFDLLDRHGCSFAVGATPFLQGLVAIARDSGRSLPGLRNFLCGGASVPPDLIYEAATLFPNCIPWRCFGATEVPTLTCGPSQRDNLRLGAETDGRIHGAEVRIVDNDGRTLTNGEEGEILAREPSMALGYVLEEDNKEAYDKDGFFRMGDLGRIVDLDHILCTGRKKDLIIRAGENISAREIEDVIFQSPKVAEVAIVSMPSRKTGEAICAFVVVELGQSIDFAEVAQLVRASGLAIQKTPEHVEIVAELPKTASGKVRKDQLRHAAKAFARD